MNQSTYHLSHLCSYFQFIMSASYIIEHRNPGLPAIFEHDMKGLQGSCSVCSSTPLLLVRMDHVFNYTLIFRGYDMKFCTRVLSSDTLFGNWQDFFCKRKYVIIGLIEKNI